MQILFSQSLPFLLTFVQGQNEKKKATQNQNIHVVNQDNESATSNDELCTEIT